MANNEDDASAGSLCSGIVDKIYHMENGAGNGVDMKGFPWEMVCVGDGDANTSTATTNATTTTSSSTNSSSSINYNNDSDEYEIAENDVKGEDIDKKDGKNVILGLKWSFFLKDGKLKMPHHQHFYNAMVLFCQKAKDDGGATLPKGFGNGFLKTLDGQGYTFWIPTSNMVEWKRLTSGEKATYEKNKMNQIRSQNKKLLKLGQQPIPEWKTPAEEEKVERPVMKTNWLDLHFQKIEDPKEKISKLLKDTIFKRVLNNHDHQPAVCASVASVPVTPDGRKRRAMARPEPIDVRTKQPNESLLWTWRGVDKLDGFVEGLLNATVSSGDIINTNPDACKPTGRFLPRTSGKDLKIPLIDRRNTFLLYKIRQEDEEGGDVDDLIIELRNLKGYTDQELRTSIIKANKGRSSFVEGATLVVPKMTTKREGALLHIQIRKGDTFLELADNLIRASKFVTAESVSPELRPGEFVDIPICADSDRTGSIIKTTLRVAVCNGETREGIVESLAAFYHAPQKKISNCLESINKPLEADYLLPGDIIRVPDPRDDCSMAR